MKLRLRYDEIDVTFEHFDTWEDAEGELTHDDCPTYIYITEEEKLYRIRY